jgi:hypothetical protein
MRHLPDEGPIEAEQEGDKAVDNFTDDQGGDCGTDSAGDYSDDSFGTTLADGGDGGFDGSGDDSDDGWDDTSDDGSSTDEDYGTDYDPGAGAFDSQSDMALNGSGGSLVPEDSNRQKQINQQIDPLLKPQVDAWKHSGKSEPIQWPVPDPEHDPIFGPHAGVDQ